jgi:hypothetical protein
MKITNDHLTQLNSRLEDVVLGVIHLEGSMKSGEESQKVYDDMANVIVSSVFLAHEVLGVNAYLETGSAGRFVPLIFKEFEDIVRVISSAKGFGITRGSLIV